MHAATECAIASTPPWSVGAGGSPCVSSGSITDAWPRSRLCPHARLRPSAVLITNAPVRSAPVPDVVGTEISGTCGGRASTRPASTSSGVDP